MRILRSLGKTGFATAYTVGSGACRIVNRRPGFDGSLPFIICYHRVVESFSRSAESSIPSMLVSAAMLERHIDWLARRFSLVSLDEIGLQLESERSVRKPAAAITFDDGYSDVFQHGFPLLKRKGVPAAVFVVTDLVGTGTPQVFDRLYFLLRMIDSRGLPLAQTVEKAVAAADCGQLDLKTGVPEDDEPFRIMTLLLSRLPRASVELVLTVLQQRVAVDWKILEESAPLTWEMIEQMHRAGITIGSHTKSHSLLTSENLGDASRQLIESKTMLESRLNAEIRHFAYPDGRFNPAVVQAVDSAGYRYAYGICRQRDARFPLLTIPRKVLWERACVNLWGGFSPSIMNCHAHGAFEPKDRCAHDHSGRESGEKNGTIN